MTKPASSKVADLFSRGIERSERRNLEQQLPARQPGEALNNTSTFDAANAAIDRILNALNNYGKQTA